jgi:hypothetical protein
MRRFSVCLIAIALPTFLGNQASAWNSIGHMTVAKIAFDEMDAKTQLALFNLLKQHPHFKDYLTASKPDDIDNEVQWVIVRSAVWADWVRGSKTDGRGVNINVFNRGEEHYVNIPLIDPKDEKFFAGKTLIDPDLPNIVTALKTRANDLKTKTAAAVDRAVAACWLFHLAGDIHQPMHNVAYFSSDPAFQKGDLGGNLFGIKAGGRKWKLHQYWDDILGADSDYNDDSPKHQGEIYREAVKLAESLRGLKMTDVDLQKLKNNLTFASWSREGFELARTVAYQKGDDSGLLKAVPIKFKMPIPAEAEEVGQEYIQRARATAERQVVLAGKRLAIRIKSLIR